MKNIQLFFILIVSLMFNQICISFDNSDLRIEETIIRFHKTMKDIPHIGIKERIFFSTLNIFSILDFFQEGFSIEDLVTVYGCQSHKHKSFISYQKAKTEYEKNKISLEFAHKYLKCSEFYNQKIEEKIKKIK